MKMDTMTKVLLVGIFLLLLMLMLRSLIPSHAVSAAAEDEKIITSVWIGISEMKTPERKRPEVPDQMNSPRF